MMWSRWRQEGGQFRGVAWPASGGRMQSDYDPTDENRERQRGGMLS
jgi:hypothetical protein